ncbi:MAG: antibiotic biosynthesis monooxygenase [Flavobacteriales bacterium]|nr:antibiotic biosynthesis monooxygenase [Flavobacteriales bacterium]
MSLQRIVKMTFEADRCQDFEEKFETIKDLIAGQEGCLGVRLLKEQTGSGVYFTYSEWESEADLNAYRKSDLFGEVWPTVKAWFKEKPEAWSTQLIN